MIQQDLDHRQIAVDIKSAEESARLTLLAAIFLPLSLSTSLLAMSTRLENLHTLLYDFVGVAIIFCGLAVVFYGVVLNIQKLSRSTKDPSKKLKRYGPAMRQLQESSRFFSWPLAYVLITVSFLVGMLKDIKLGGKVFGYLIAGVAGLFIAIPVVQKALSAVRIRFRRFNQPRSLPAASQSVA